MSSYSLNSKKRMHLSYEGLNESSCHLLPVHLKKYHAKKHSDWMSLAIVLASYAQGQTGSNPCVGAVLVKNSRLIGIGTHLKQGEAHAEIHAINMAGSNVHGSTLYVTLEPCSHQGLTGPCADAVINAGIKQVFIATQDANPKVSGRGIERLKKAGIEVHIGLCQQEANELLHAFFLTQKNQRSYLILKSASSLDGKLALITQESKWVTGIEAREDVHQLRASVDGILTAIGTVSADNPMLNARLDIETRQPARIVIDRQGHISEDSQLVQTAKTQRTILFGHYTESKAQSLQAFGCEVVEFIDLPTLLKWTLQAGLMTIMVEAGPKLITALLDAELIDEWVAYQSPRVFGGDQSIYLNTKTLPINKIDSFQLIKCDILGNDLRIIMRKMDKESNPHKSLKEQV
ncbi:bifunctional diaminohydroxyphosphoribosylaminopyrimidine deaminase/5-amino-6-(5-phosphoribosylamino)uracil reductase RibD [Thorsellia kenyensis]|uniref:Riboflavin biosynthesis protein RibD n=1 Tax=Thorsellia kenyensis TaxID=1549888 RepID=A0ABV6CCA1_9GAMM